MKDGDLVRMNEKYSIPAEERRKVYVVNGEPYESCGRKYVKLLGFPSGFAVDGLEVIDV